MTQFRFHLDDGSFRDLEVAPGTSVMQAAIANGVPGIIGECGGSAMCATCHVHVVAGAELLDARSEIEDEMLDCAASPPDATSRLGCQCFAPASGRVELRMPASQV